MNPATDGLAALSQICRYGGLKQLTVAVAHGLKDLAYSLLGQKRILFQSWGNRARRPSLVHLARRSPIKPWLGQHGGMKYVHELL